MGRRTGRPSAAPHLMEHVHRRRGARPRRVQRWGNSHQRPRGSRWPSGRPNRAGTGSPALNTGRSGKKPGQNVGRVPSPRRYSSVAARTSPSGVVRGRPKCPQPPRVFRKKAPPPDPPVQRLIHRVALYPGRSGQYSPRLRRYRSAGVPVTETPPVQYHRTLWISSVSVADAAARHAGGGCQACLRSKAATMARNAPRLRDGVHCRQPNRGRPI